MRLETPPGLDARPCVETSHIMKHPYLLAGRHCFGGVDLEKRLIQTFANLSHCLPLNGYSRFDGKDFRFGAAALNSNLLILRASTSGTSLFIGSGEMQRSMLDWSL